MNQFPQASPHSGALLINKPVGLTSSDVVVKLKIALTKNGYFEKGFRIGHGGTLDPFASGVLVVLLGEATKLADSYLHSKKIYTGIIQLGIQTDTADHTGTIVQQHDLPASAKLSESEWNAIAQIFVQGPYLQVPPMYSAKKVDGQALHHLARQGIEIERAPILKKIESFQIQTHVERPTELAFSVACESGTYVRVIAEDLAKLAGTFAHLKTLVRAQSSDAQLEKTLDLEPVLEKLNSQTDLHTLGNFIPLPAVASHLKSIEIDEVTAQSVRCGIVKTNQQILQNVEKECPQARYVLIKNSTGPVALLEKSAGSETFRIQRVFNPVATS
jgi:tRNA pseudouridine55 synthase